MLKTFQHTFTQCRKKVTLLVDTGAEVSLIKLDVLRDEAQCMELEKKLQLTGIGEGSETVQFKTKLTFENGKSFNFLIPDGRLGINEDGILGSDFFEKTGAIIDYKENVLRAWKHDFELTNLENSSVNLNRKANQNSRCRKDIKEVQASSDDRETGELFTNVSKDCFDYGFSNEADSEESNKQLLEFDMSSSDKDDSSDEDCVSNDGDESDSDFQVIKKRSAVFLTVKVNRNGVGEIPKIDLAKGIYLVNCLVEAKNKTASVLVVNTLNDAASVVLPEFELENYMVPSASVDKKYENSMAKCFSINWNKRFQRLKEKLDFSHLKNFEKEALDNVLETNTEAFFLEGDALNRDEMFEHEIVLKEHYKPVNTRQYKTPLALKGELDVNVNRMLEKDLIAESNSPWNMPVLLVPKKMDNSKEKKYRMVVDLRKLNDLIVQDAYPLPLIDEILGQLGNARYFSVLDLYSGFYQLGLSPESRKYTSFSVNGKKYEFKRLPMGLKNSPAYFTRMMNHVLSGLIGFDCLVYLDDLIIFGATLDEHNEHLRKVLEKLKKFGLKLQPDKCEFLRKEVVFLGHTVTGDGIFPDESKFSVVKNFPRTMNQKQMKSFLGLTGYYKKFIKDYGKIAAPLNKLTSSKVDFKWIEDVHTVAFEKLKELLITPPILIYPDMNQEFILTTDASGKGLGAVLSQMKDGRDRPIAYASRALSQAEINRHRDSAIEKELLAIVWAVKHFRHYLYGSKFTIYTDHKPLIHLNSMNNANDKLMRFKMELAEYDFEIRYKQGPINTNADTLSRMFLLHCVDENEQKKMMEECHSSPLAGHRNANTTVERIKEIGFSWPSVRKDVEKFVRMCDSCQKNKLYLKTKLPMQITDTPSGPWEKCSIDIVGPLPVTLKGKKYILTFQDLFSKFIIAIPLETQESEEVAKALVDNVFLSYGICKTILSDQGQNFMSKLFKNMCRLFGIKKIRTSAFRPQSNGSIERMHRSLKEYIIHFIDSNQRNWDEFLKLACFAHNSSIHLSTKFQPFELTLGRKVNIPWSFISNKGKDNPFYAHGDYVAELKRNLNAIFEVAKENLKLAKEKQKLQVDKKLKVVDFNIGDQVQLLNETVRQGRSRKLGPQWNGPYTIVDKIGDVNYSIKMGRKSKIVHGNKLKHYYD